MLKDLLIKNRSYRRFRPEPVPKPEDLHDMIDSARLSPSARNDQPIKFLLIHSKKACDAVFPHCSWAGYLRDWEGPSPQERPTSYIVVLGDKSISEKFDTDAGIMCQSILLTAVEKGFGGCILGSIDREAIRKIFSIEEKYIIRYLIALGKPAETVVTEDMKNNDTHYYRDNESVHHVPKRRINELIVHQY